MKIKSFLTGAIIMISSICMAFTISDEDAFANAWVHVKFAGQQNFVCINTNLQCNEIPSNPCLIWIVDLGRTTPAYYPGCTNTIYHSVIEDADYDPSSIIVDAD